jgi:hypothetical protein
VGVRPVVVLDVFALVPVQSPRPSLSMIGEPDTPPTVLAPVIHSGPHTTGMPSQVERQGKRPINGRTPILANGCVRLSRYFPRACIYNRVLSGIGVLVLRGFTALCFALRRRARRQPNRKFNGAL